MNPKVVFGNPDSPACELILDRDPDRLRSTCTFYAPSVSGRRLEEEDESETLAAIRSLKAELAEVKAELAQLKAKSAATKH